MNTKVNKELTSKELAKQAGDLVAPIKEKEKETKEKIVTCITFLTTIVTIGAYVVMYAYKTGYLAVFSIPPACVQVKLTDYLPFLLKMFGLSIALIWYIAAIKSDTALKTIKINGYRITYGGIVLSFIFESQKAFSPLPKMLSFFLPFIIAACIELLFFSYKKIRKWKATKKPAVVTKEQKNIILYDLIYETLFYRYYIHSGIFLLILVVTIAPLLGRQAGKGICEFQTFQHEETQYVIIADYGESVIAQKAVVVNNGIEISTDNYTYFSKTGIEFENRLYDTVSRVTSLSP